MAIRTVLREGHIMSAWRKLTVVMVAALFLVTSCKTEDSARPAAGTNAGDISNKFASSSCPIQPDTELITARWKALGAQYGPLGCPKTAEEPAGPGGRRVVFRGGEIVWSPAQGKSMAVAVYAQDDNVIVNWGVSAPFHYDKFIVRWNVEGVHNSLDQVDVGSYIDPDRGFYALRHPAKGRYSIQVEGCDTGVGGSTCRQGFTTAASVDYDLPIPATGCRQKPAGDIGQRWADLGGREGPLGCPAEDERAASGGARAQAFDNGEVVWSPRQGSHLTVAVYKDPQGRLAADWGDTRPYSYDKFIVRWDLNGKNVGQEDVAAGRSGRWSSPAGAYGRYSVIVEGCDKSTGSSSKCKQGFTTAASVEIKKPPEQPPADQSCSLKPAEPLLTRWIATGAKTGPLGCPTGAEQQAADGVRRMAFDHGEIVYSPRQGSAMTVATYQRGADLVVDWGDTAPHNYDYFIVNLERGGTRLGQVDVNNGPRTAGSFAFHATRTDKEADEGIPMADGSGIYSASVEGCDRKVIGKNPCNEKFTAKANARYTTTGDLDLSKIPVPTTVDDAYAQVDERTLAAANHLSCPAGGMPPQAYKDEDRFGTIALAKLYVVRAHTGHDGPTPRCNGVRLNERVEVNDALRVQTIRSNSGTSSDKFLVCTREGEYDVAMKSYITLAYAFHDQLDYDVQYHLLRLLNKRGPHDTGDDRVCHTTDESENHKVLIESARYLTNQLVAQENGDKKYDNARNGMDAFILGKLQGFLKNDFLEYNARPYQRYTLAGIQNLHDFAHNKDVQRAAQMVLDYVSAKYAVSSNDARRNPPYRRLTDYYHPDLFNQESDPLKDRMLALFGPTAVMKELKPALHVPEGSVGEMMLAGISGYRPTKAVADLIVNHDHQSFFQRINHVGAEAYTAEPDFLITSGGYPTPYAYTVAGIGRDKDKGRTVPTTLMPSGHLISVEQMIRIESGKDGDGCLAPRFACGANVIVPASYTPKDRPECWIKQGTWLFIDSASAACNTAPDQTRGFYAVVRFPNPQEGGIKASFFEAVPKSEVNGVPLVTFAQRTLDRNGGRTYATPTDGHILTYTTWAGTDVTFTHRRGYVVVSTGRPEIDKVPWGPNTGPLATGTIINSRGHTGYLTIDNPALGARLTLDFRNAAKPVRTEGPIPSA